MQAEKTTITSDTTDILHHAGLINADLEALAACYERLGFTLTPVSIPRVVTRPGAAPETLGVGNRHAIFSDNYLELLGVVDPQRWGQITKEQRGPYDIDVPLSRYPGLHVMHFGTDQIGLVRERLVRQGVACSEISRFQRNVQTEAGEKMMKARTIHFAPGSNPEGLLQIAQHDTPELVLQPRYMIHANGATALTEIVVCAEDPLTYLYKYEKYTGHRGSCLDINNFILDLGHSIIKIIDPHRLNSMIPGYPIPVLPFMAAFTVETISPERSRAVLAGNGIPFLERDGSIIVYPQHACGCAVVFKKDHHI
jgi:hypothetical protein